MNDFTKDFAQALFNPDKVSVNIFAVGCEPLV